MTIEPEKAPVTQLEDLQRTWEQAWNRTVSEMRNAKVVNMKIQREDKRTDALCLRIEATAEGAISQTWTEEFLVLEFRGLACKHPTRPLLVALSSSERYLKQAPPKELLTRRYRKELQPFFDSVTFVR